MPLNGYYNRFDSSKKYIKSLFLAGKGLQSAELNEIQDYHNYAIKNIGDAIFKDGDVIRGCTCVINQESGTTTVESGQVYLNGAVRDIHEGNFVIPVSCSVKIGAYYRESEITALEDPTLRDPAVGTRNYQEMGAARLKYTLTWGYQADGVTDIDPGLGDFYPIYNVSNGILIQTAPAPQLDSVSTALARYDNDSNGSYVVNGMTVTCLSADSEGQVFSIKEGKAHVEGYEITLPYSLRTRFENEVDIATVYSDPYTFLPDALSVMTVTLNNQPLHQVLNVAITAQKTVTVTHGSYNGAMDQLPDTSILEIVSVTQGNTVYSYGDDYVLTSGCVNWSPSGAEPAPGSTYSTTYRYMTTAEPYNITDSGFDVSGAVPNSIIFVDYQWRPPRYDLITIDSEGVVRKIKGLAHRSSPKVPAAPIGQLVLANIEQNWSSGGLPKITNNAIKVVKMNEIEDIRNLLSDLYYLVAQERLKSNANASDPSTKKGVFVDPFLDDDMRDQGIEQTAAIFDGILTLPIIPTVIDGGKSDRSYLLPYDLEAVVAQELLTGSMKINPYQAFDPIPADVTITLDVDRWTDKQTQWLSPTTQYYSQMYGGSFSPYYSYASSTQLAGSTTNTVEYMRQIRQAFRIEGFKPHEELTEARFDGLALEID